MKVAREGLPFIVAAFVPLAMLIALAAARGGLWVVFAGLWTPIAMWVPAFFRDPDRPGPRGEDLVLAPADGKIVKVDEVDEPDFVGGRAVKVSVFMNVFNVHVNRYPITGTVAYRSYRAGKFFNATLDKASEHNEQMSLGVETPRGRVLVRQIAGLVARRIITDDHPGAPATQGNRLGLIRFGSRVDTFLPASATVRVALGDHVKAGQTVLAELYDETSG